MGKIRLGEEEIQLINLFEKLTGARPRDALQEDDSVCFLLDKEDMGMAIGKGGCNIEKARNTLGKNIRLVEYSDDHVQFVRNMFHPCSISEVRVSKSGRGKNMVIKTSKKERRQVIGRCGERIKLARRLLDRYLDLKDVIIETG